jgi:hypothetical protein
VKFTVYQITPPKNYRDAEYEASSHFKALRDVMCFGNEKGHVTEAIKSKFYNPVATVEAETLEHVYKIMNLWSDEDEARVTRLAPLHSLSVGDVVADADGKLHSVERFGFEEVV